MNIIAKHIGKKKVKLPFPKESPCKIAYIVAYTVIVLLLMQTTVAQAAELIRLSLSDGTTSDETVINFNNSASDAFDAYDSQKLWVGNIPQLYTNVGTDTLVINTLKTLSTNTLVYLGIRIPTTGQHTITVIQNGLTLPAILWDRTLNVKQDLTLNPSYSFTTTAGNTGNRFALIFTTQVNWTGATNTDWNTATNWDSGFVPGIYDNVSITNVSNAPIINQSPSTPARCNDLTLSSLASLTINAGKAITIGGNISNDGTITLKSDATGTATLINTGSITGSGIYNAEQYLAGTGGATPNGVFWYVTSPVPGATSNVFDAGGTNKLWSYSEVTNAYTAITDNATALPAANGYVARLGANTTVNFTSSAFNTGNISTAVLTSTITSGENRGYNLIGNPYPSYLDWEAVDTIDFSSTIWYRTHDGSGTQLFDTYNGVSHIGTNNNGNGAVTQFIPPMQAVWVKTKVNNASMNFIDAMRSHQSANNLHKTSVNELIRLTLADGTTSDETVINFNNNASDVFEAFDSEKKWGVNMPQLYTTNITKDTLVINTLNNLSLNTVVDLGIKTLKEGQYSITATENGLVLPAILWDKTLNVKQDLTLNPKYTFSSTATNNANRFALIFANEATTGINTVANDANLVQIFQSAKNLMVVLNGNSKPEGIINVYDVMGRKVFSQEITGNTNSIFMNNAIGVYIVQVQNKKQVVNKKIVIN